MRGNLQLPQYKAIRNISTQLVQSRYSYNTFTHLQQTPFSSERTTMASPREITIIGGGIIGCSTAYYLTRHPSYSPSTHRITLLEAAATSTGGRTSDSVLQDPATLTLDADASLRNPAHDGIAGGASGKAGGLLALWAFPSNIVPLSFRLHDELAKEHGGAQRWGYRRCWAGQIECSARVPPGLASSSGSGKDDDGGGGDGTQKSASKGLHKDHRKDELRKLGVPEELDWVDATTAAGGGVMRAYDGIGTPDDTAQVHPELFTRALAQFAEDSGVQIITGARATLITRSADESSVESVTYEKDGEAITLRTTDCIVAAGPWTRRLLPEIPVTASRAHSVVLRTPRPWSAHTLFTAIRLPAGFRTPVAKMAKSGPEKPGVLRAQQIVEPEIYARPDGTVYTCGPTDEAVPLPVASAEVEVDAARCEDLIAQLNGISAEARQDGEVLARQACYLPQGGPYIGQVGDTKGLIVAAGHTCWGIQNAPGTGKLVSEIVFDGKPMSARLGGCDPALVL
ncbi:FAD dependent oxidoreductase [Nemania sp. FL0916]|nr:FAD dependent oxidoreductase [Nemania sp. FL0916]